MSAPPIRCTWLVTFSMCLLAGCGKSEAQRIADERAMVAPILVKFEKQARQELEKLKGIREEIDALLRKADAFESVRSQGGEFGRVLSKGISDLSRAEAKLRVMEARTMEVVESPFKKAANEFTSQVSELLTKHAISKDTHDWAVLQRQRLSEEYRNELNVTKDYAEGR